MTLYFFLRSIQILENNCLLSSSSLNTFFVLFYDINLDDFDDVTECPKISLNKFYK